MLDFIALAQTCAPQVHHETLSRIVAVESAFNPYAIGVVGGRLQQQPSSREQAVATARALQASGHNFSVGLAQVNQQHFKRFGLTLETAFEPCANLNAGAVILSECFARAGGREDQPALRAAFSCYCSGNFRTGFDHGYVTKVVHAEAARVPKVPRLIPIAEDAALRVRAFLPASARSKPATQSVSPTPAPSARPSSASDADPRSALLF